MCCVLTLECVEVCVSHPHRPERAGVFRRRGVVREGAKSGRCFLFSVSSSGCFMLTLRVHYGRHKPAVRIPHSAPESKHFNRFQASI